MGIYFAAHTEKVRRSPCEPVRTRGGKRSAGSHHDLEPFISESLEWTLLLY